MPCFTHDVIAQAARPISVAKLHKRRSNDSSFVAGHQAPDEQWRTGHAGLPLSSPLWVLAAMSMSASMPVQAQTKVRIGKPQAGAFQFVPVDVGLEVGISRSMVSTLNPPTSGRPARAAGADRRRA